MPGIKGLRKLLGKIVAPLLGSHTVAELIATLVLVRIWPNRDANIRRMVREHAVDETCCGHVEYSVDPQLADVGLRPVEGSDVAVHVAVVTEPHDLTVLVAEEAGQPCRFHRKHVSVCFVEREVEHGVPVKDGDLLRADGLGESVELQHLVLDIARRAALRRTLRRARRVPLLQSKHLIFRESRHLISVEGSVFLRALEGGGDAVPAPVWMRLLRNHNRRKWTNR